MASELPLEAEEFLSHLAIEKGRAANTLAAYRRDLTDYVEQLRGKAIAFATYEDVLAHHHALQRRGLAPSSVNRAMAAIRGLHRYLFAEGMSDGDPTAEVEPAKLPRGLPRALSEPDVERLFAAITGSERALKRDRAIIELLYGTGMRISELVALSGADVDTVGAMVRVTGKGDKERLVPLGRLAAEALQTWHSPGGRDAYAPETWASRDDEAAIFLNHRGGRLSRQGVWGVVRKHGLQAGIANRLTPHVLRHSCATHMLDHGADIRTVQELLGHASVTTTQLYTKVSTDLLVREYRRAHPRAKSRPGST